MTAAPGKQVCLGIITGAHGVRGWVRIKPFTETPDGLTAYGPLSDEAGARRFDIMETRIANDAVLARIDGVTDRDTARALVRTALFVPRSALPEAEDESWYHADLIGLQAADAGGTVIGMVTAVHNFGAGDLLEITPARGQSALVPFTRANVPAVDLEGGRLHLCPPAGLFATEEDEHQAGDQAAGTDAPEDGAS